MWANRYNVAIEVAADSGQGPVGLPGDPEEQGGMLAVQGLDSMEKWLCWSSMGVAGVLLLLFLLDLILGIPFSGISPTVDVISILACGLVLYLAYDAFRDIR